uniref:Mos1 transposase HTH domain-containing protein n=1 Tax=Acrobeloides nanus TaxID=290746 RepID=A0A914CWG2_9BILA
MEKNRDIIRKLLKFEFELGHSAKEAMNNINQAKGNGTVSKATAYLWYSNFRSNKMDIEDKKRSGCPQEVDRVAVVNAVEAHPSMTTRMLAEDFECNHTEIVEKLHDAGKKWLKSRWVPKELTEVQKRKRLEIVTRKQFFDSKDREWYRRGIHQLEERWKKVMESEGEYFDY